MKKKYILIGILILGLALGARYLIFNNQEAIEVNTMKTYRGAIKMTIQLSGTIDTEEVEIIPLQANIGVVNTYVEENDLVEKGQLLAELDTEDLVLALEKARINYQQLKADLSNLSKDNSQATLLNNGVLKREEDLKNLEGDLITATEDMKKAEQLYSAGGISQVEYENSVQRAQDINNQIKAAQLNRDDAVTNYQSYNTKKSEDMATLQRQIKAAELDIADWNNKIKDSKIYSSIAGYVTDFPLESSKKTLSGDRVVIYGKDSYEFVGRAGQQEALQIKEGQSGVVQVDGLNKDYRGVVSFISKIATIDNTGSQLPKVEIRIKIEDPDESIKFGYEGSGIINVDSVEDTLIVNTECIRKEDGRDYVFVVEDGIAKKTYVETGITDTYLIGILNGLEEDDIVVVNPPADLVDATTVKTLSGE